MLSPKALNILEAPLYISCPNDKPTHICKYNTELSIISVGVFNNIIRGLDKNMPSIKRIKELNNVKYIELRKVVLSILSFFAPKNCPITIEKALVKPIAKDKKKNIVEVVAPIEANALEPTNLPIMIELLKYSSYKHRYRKIYYSLKRTSYSHIFCHNKKPQKNYAYMLYVFLKKYKYIVKNFKFIKNYIF